MTDEKKVQIDYHLTGSSHLSVMDASALTFTGPIGDCLTHGEVEPFTISVYRGVVTYAKISVCPRCYIEWIAANVTAVVPRQKPEALTP